MTRALNVFLVAPNLATRGGFELQMSELAAGLARMGVAPDVFIRQPVDPAHPYLHAMHRAGVRVHSPAAWWAAWLDPPKRLRDRLRAVILSLLTPLCWAVALVDAPLRRRSMDASLQGVRGVLGRWVGRLTNVDGLTWWLTRSMDSAARKRVPDLIDVQHSMIPAGIEHAIRRNVPVVYTEYGAPDEALASVWSGLRPVIHGVDHVIGRAEASIRGLRVLCGLPEHVPWTIVPNAVVSVPDGGPSATTLPADDDRVVIAVIGRLSEEKGSHHALEAFRDLARRHPRVDLVMAGDGPMRDALVCQAEEWGIAERVTFTGAYDDLEPIVSRAHIVLHPTLNDGRSVAVLEAMAWGRPVVAAAVGGILELVRDGETGFLVAPGDPIAMAEALCPLVEDAALRQQMGAAARREFLRGGYTVDEMVRQTVAAYQLALEAHGSNAVRRTVPA